MRLTAVLSLLVSISPVAADLAWQVYDAWPFETAEAVKRQAETAKTASAADPLTIGLTEKPGPALKFRLIPAGKFQMGSPANEPGHEADEPLHAETIDAPFYMMDTQLTVEAYRALMRAEPPGMPADADPKLPVAVSYRDAVDKVLPVIAKVAPKGWRAILPDRVRMEYAARAGVATMNPGGNTEKDADAYVWHKANSDNKVHPVARKKPNAWGLYDVLGNRWHWYWAGPGSNGDASKDNHLVYGGAYNTPAGGNGARLANIMVSRTPEGVRYALIRTDTPFPKGHPDTSAVKPDQ
ncbi:MAG: formylglycine-generating enzyme family protein [Gemmataceae bacterium]|nr:formylglycine-generating enzyme family protein [Gemmataceae bacterium]